MINQIIEFLVDNKFTLLIPILFATVLLILDTYANKNKISVVGLVLFIISFSGFIFIIFKDIKIFKIDIILFVSILILIAFLYNSAAYARASYKYNKMASLLIALPSNIESQVYVYLDEKSRFMIFTDQFYELFFNFNIDKKNWMKYFNYVIIENNNYNYKQFIKFFQTIEERNYKIQFVFNNDYIVPLQLMKRKIILNGKLLGYVLINQKLTLSEVYKENVNNEFRKRQHIYFDLLGQPIAYYDFGKNRFILNSLMCRLLGIEENELNRSAFEQLIHEEDKKNFDSRKAFNDHINKNYYRLNTINGVEWFEESTVEFEERQYIVLYRTDFSMIKIEMFNYVNLIDDIKNFKSFNFILILIAVKDIPEINDKIGKDGCEIVISQFFRNLNTYAGEAKKIYKVGQIEYALIVEDVEKYDLILRDLDDDYSGYLGNEIYLNEVKFILKNSVGVVKSDAVVVQTAESIVKAGFDALNLASDDKYMKRYSVYQPKKHIENPANYDIDLSDDFLDKLLKD